MIKELLIAVALGALLGFGLTGGYLAVKNNRGTKVFSTTTAPTRTLPAPSGSTLSLSPAPSGSLDSAENDAVVIEAPEDGAITADSKITLKGSSSPQSSIIITTAANNYFTTSGDSGSFSSDIELESGPNIIQITSIDTEDNQVSTEILVTYSTAKI